jgi:predicted DNA-binding mobile mystery protein A
MRQAKATTARILRNYLVKNGHGVAARRFTPQNHEIRRRLDDALLGFRAVRQTMMDKDRNCWLRAVRQATGVPVYVLAKRLGVTKHEVFRLETAERTSRIVLANLKRAAEALGCELVYALVPRKGSLEDLAAAEREARVAALAMAGEKRKERVKQIYEWVVENSEQ